MRQTAPIVARSPGIHTNCDRLVFILKGNHPFKPHAKVGFRVQYTKQVMTGPKREVLMPLEGHPALLLTILAPSQLAQHNGYVVSPTDLQTLSAGKSSTFKEIRWVKQINSGLKDQTQLVISVRDKHPFAAFTAVDSEGNLLVIVDVAALANGNVPSPAPSSSSSDQLPS